MWEQLVNHHYLSTTLGENETVSCHFFFDLFLHCVSVLVGSCLHPIAFPYRLPQVASCSCMGDKGRQALVLESKEGILLLILQMHEERRDLSPVWP